MIVKIDSVSGKNLAVLLSFIHGDENYVELAWTSPVRNVFVSVKSITPIEHQFGLYNITLEIREFISKASTGGMDRVDPKYLLRVYNILGQEWSDEKYPPISHGTRVKTTQANLVLRREFAQETWANRKWQVFGMVVNHHDSHGLCYKVQHDDGTLGYYDPSEIEVVS